MKVFVYQKPNGVYYALNEKEAWHENKQNNPLVRYGEKRFIGCADDTEYKQKAAQVQNETYNRARQEAYEKGYTGEQLSEYTQQRQIEILQHEYPNLEQELMQELAEKAKQNPEQPRDHSVIEIGSGGGSANLASEQVKRAMNKI